MLQTIQQDVPESLVDASATMARNARPASSFFELAIIATLLIQTGCGATPASLATNELAAPVYELADAASQPKRFHGLFVEGTAPAEALRKRFAALMFQVSQVKTVSDDEAALHVLIDDSAGQRVAEADWTVVKQSGKWKLKTAPLP